MLSKEVKLLDEQEKYLEYEFLEWLLERENPRVGARDQYFMLVVQYGSHINKVLRKRMNLSR